MGIEDLVLNAIILSLLKSTGLLLLFFLKPDEKQIGQSDQVSYSFIFKNRSFLLYFIPWLMFSVVNYTAVPIVDSIGKVFSDEIASLSPVIENVTAGIFAVVFGFFADFIGRKRLILAGFSLLGVGYACLGLFLGNIYAWWFYTIADGIAWGAFYTIFIMTLWGDLSQEKSSEKYYAIGSLPFLFSNFMRLSISTYVATISESAVFSFASFFLFLAVLPLIYAPETLPEKKMKERELKKYIEKAQKVKEKTQKKEAEKTQIENRDIEVKSESEYFEEKLKEAEKYY
jgi:MFS family permease